MSNSTQSEFPVLNPNTSLAYLPPDIAVQLEVYRYIVVSASAVYGWDLLSNTRAHYLLLFRYRPSVATAAYFVSILATAVFVVGCVVFHIAPLDSCHTLTLLIVISYPIAIPASSFLFLLRVRAVFGTAPVIQWFFSFLWLGVLGSALTLPFALHGTHIGPTKYCIDSNVQSFASVGMIGATIFDTSVFLAISWRLASASMEGTTLREKVSLFCRGRTLPALSRGLLQSGQVYYLISVLGHVTGIVMLLAPSVLPFYRAVLTTPIAALMNAMGCRVFRVIKFGDYREDSSVPLSFTARPENSTSPSHMHRVGDPQLGVHLCDAKGQPLSRIVFNPEVVESTQVDFMWDSASKIHEV